MVSKEKVDELCRLLRNQEAVLRTYQSGARIHEARSILNGIVNQIPNIQVFLEHGMEDEVNSTYKHMLKLHDDARAFIAENKL